MISSTFYRVFPLKYQDPKVRTTVDIISQNRDILRCMWASLSNPSWKSIPKPPEQMSCQSHSIVLCKTAKVWNFWKSADNCGQSLSQGGTWHRNSSNAFNIADKVITIPFRINRDITDGSLAAENEFIAWGTIFAFFAINNTTGTSRFKEGQVDLLPFWFYEVYPVKSNVNYEIYLVLVGRNSVSTHQMDSVPILVCFFWKN